MVDAGVSTLVIRFFGLSQFAWPTGPRGSQHEPAEPKECAENRLSTRSKSQRPTAYLPFSGCSVLRF